MYTCWDGWIRKAVILLIIFGCYEYILQPISIFGRCIDEDIEDVRYVCQAT